MNERIFELAEQALNIVSNKRGQLERTRDPCEYDQVFAELIVQECINTVQTFRTRMDASNDNIVVALKERFGVKE
jgi:hypothetical protein